MKLFALIWLVCGLASVLHAQEPSPAPAPTPPAELFLERAPEFAQWTVTSKSPDAVEDNTPAVEPSPKAAQPTPGSGRHRSDKQAVEPADAKPTPSPTPGTERTTSVTKTKTIRFEHIANSSGENIDRWCLPGIQITTQGGGQAVVSLPGAGANSSYVDYSQADFEGFEWLSTQNFKGIEQVSEQECFVFREKIKGHPAGSEGPTERVACINSATRLPVTLQTEDESLTYRFELAPTAMLKPPADVMAKVEEWKKSVEQSELMPAKP